MGFRKNVRIFLAAGVVAAACAGAGVVNHTPATRPDRQEPITQQETAMDREAAMEHSAADYNTASRVVSNAPVPEPATLAVLGLGGIMLFIRRR